MSHNVNRTTTNKQRDEMVVMEANDAETKSDDFATLDLVYVLGICLLVVLSFWFVF